MFAGTLKTSLLVVDWSKFLLQRWGKLGSPLCNCDNQPGSLGSVVPDAVRPVTPAIWPLQVVRCLYTI